MSNDFFSAITENVRFPYESLQELADINGRTLNRMAEIQLRFARLGIEGSMEQARLLTGVNNYDDLLSAESDLASSYGDRIMGLVNETTELMTESQDQLVKWMGKRFEDGSKGVARQAKPKPAARKTSTATAAKSQPKAA